MKRNIIIIMAAVVVVVVAGAAAVVFIGMQNIIIFFSFLFRRNGRSAHELIIKYLEKLSQTTI